jgi:UDP:flavonoid glycosyltransferase YjiC (YdhE family)
VATILYAWEYGADLGHISVFLPIAKKLRAQGHNLRISIPFSANSASLIKKILTENEFDFLDAPGSYVKMMGGEIGSHAELMQQLSCFRMKDDFNFFFKSWLDLLEEEMPDLVICDFAPVALLAARQLGIQTVLLDLGFFVPDLAQSLPSFFDYVVFSNQAINDENLKKSKQKAENRLLEMVNSTFAEFDFPLLQQFTDFYKSDKTLWLNYAELSPFKHTANTQFSGVVASENGGLTPQWKLNKFESPKIFAYLKQDNPVNKIIMEALRADNNLDVIIYIPDCNEAIKKVCNSDHLTIESSPLNMSLVLKQADLVISNAGAGLIAQTLLAGKPLLLAPTYFEQILNADRAVKLGAAISLQINATHTSILESIYSVLSNGFYTASARAFAFKHQPADVELIADTIIDTIPVSKRNSPKPIRKESTVYKFDQFDVVFLSYDEPNADENWEHLKRLIPTAKRVHGVKGFDAAHKAAANAAQTERFILVDADNRMDPVFFELQTTIPANLRHSVWQWSSINHVTGLSYPFGGVKIWTRSIVQKMRSHELCDEDNGLLLDFWSQPAYQAFCRPYSRNYTNGSPYQAFRAAYREAAKIGDMFGLDNFAEMVQRQANSSHSRRLCIWMSVGADVDNGYWSMLGARLGALHCLNANLKPSNINEYDWFDELWLDIFSRIVGQHTSGRVREVVCNDRLIAEVHDLGQKIRAIISKPPVLDMTPEESANFKVAMMNKADKALPLFHPFELQTDIC